MTRRWPSVVAALSLLVTSHIAPSLVRGQEIPPVKSKEPADAPATTMEIRGCVVGPALRAVDARTGEVDPMRRVYRLKASRSMLKQMQKDQDYQLLVRGTVRDPSREQGVNVVKDLGKTKITMGNRSTSSTDKREPDGEPTINVKSYERLESRCR